VELGGNALDSTGRTEARAQSLKCAGRARMTKIAWSAVLGVALIASLLLLVAPAEAQATRSWVSAVGDDANNCSRTTPCKTFRGAITKTADGGIINCLDSSGFGFVTITKSITIDCGGTFGGIVAATTNGVNVDADGVVVTLRNLSIDGVGRARSGSISSMAVSCTSRTARSGASVLGQPWGSISLHRRVSPASSTCRTVPSPTVATPGPMAG
jgi:hypothetical protein